ncbi:hypothetical protein FB45DRAFT_845378 [Roridomyces roridus]|uniref:F-box domain-containing protein n=1 Tax=Roridomyces roridus TaxID=1738132 RepID=A0AAD7F8V0_9AGAR|nr:hypothetical protein FB45DRAFT_845378 [Roridomyces roridus]
MLQDSCQTQSQPHTSLMHRALHVSEIVELIVSNLRPTPDNSTLAALGRTSQLFHAHALDALWHHQACASNVIKCFPDDLWESRRYVDSARFTLTFRRSITTADWDRFLHYSSRIRSFQCPSLYEEDASQIYDVLLHTEIPGKHLLPNLRSLSTNNNCQPIPSAHLALFMAPRVSAIHLLIVHASLFPVLPEKYPALKAINVGRTEWPGFDTREDAEDADPPGSRCVSALLCGLHSLELVETVYVDLVALVHLGKLPKLKALTLHGLPMPSISLSSLVDQDLFRHLLHVKLSPPWSRISSVPGFIRSWTHPPIVSLRINVPVSPTAASMQDIFSTLSEHCSSTSLKSLEISRGYSEDMDFEIGEVLPSAVLGNLTCFGNLVEFSMDTLIGYDLDDAGMADLARAWPRIEVLHFKALWHSDTPMVTIASVRVLAEHCPNLRHLELTFDASSIPSLPGSDSLPLQLNLHTLDVAHSPVTDAVETARYISVIFPNLSEIHSDKEWWRDDLDYLPENSQQDWREWGWSRVWNKVKAYFPVGDGRRLFEM